MRLLCAGQSFELSNSGGKVANRAAAKASNQDHSRDSRGECVSVEQFHAQPEEARNVGQEAVFMTESAVRCRLAIGHPTGIDRRADEGST